METGCLFLFVLGLAVINVEALSIPKYLKPCSASDPNLNECAKKHGIEAIPFIVEGDKEYRIPRMKPLQIPEVTLQPSGDLKVKFSNCKIYGLDKTQLVDINLDYKNQKAVVTLHVDEVSMEADYDVNGRLLILPIQGKGPSQIKFVNGDYVFEFDWTVVERGGVKYGKVKDYKLHYDTKRNYYHLDNLFNGDPLLGEQTNKFLDENWKEIDKDLGPAISETIGQICVSIASSFFDRIPYDQLFSP